jgi:hypothetical protein
MIPADLRALLRERRQAERKHRTRPTLADLEQDGPPLSPAAFAAIVGMGREYVRVCCVSGAIPASKVNGYWKISRETARQFVRLLVPHKPAA